MPFAQIEEAINEIQEGRMVIIVDDEDRENEGDLMVAAEKVTPEAINFMATYGRGLICLAMTGQRLDELHIPLMVSDHSNTSPYGTAFCVSIEARSNVSTGISAFDRAQTILTAIDPKTKSNDLARPGHVFPLRACDGGVLVRVQTHCLTGHVFDSLACHCHEQMDRAMEMIAAEGRGVLLYLHEMVRLRPSTALLEYHGKHGFDPNETIGLRGEQREYGIGAQILAALNIHSMRILTNHPRKLVALEAYGLKILAQVPPTTVRSASER